MNDHQLIAYGVKKGLTDEVTRILDWWSRWIHYEIEARGWLTQ